MRLAALLAACLCAWCWLQSASPGRAQEPGPFPSATPTVQPAAGNGYVSLAFNAANSSGGMVPPLPGSTQTPRPFVNANANGFAFDIVGRISPTYLASLRFDDYAIHGNDHPFLSYWQGMVLFNPRSSPLALGLGYLSAQRSTSNVSMTAVGGGILYLPTLHNGVSPYASAFFYPRLSGSGTPASGLTSLDAGVMWSPPKRGGLFYRVGGYLKSGGNAATSSPTQISGLQFGAGSAF